jgi:hypothetical protein
MNVVFNDVNDANFDCRHRDNVSVEGFKLFGVMLI